MICQPKRSGANRRRGGTTSSVRRVVRVSPPIGGNEDFSKIAVLEALDALNLVFRVDGRVGERLVYRDEESGFQFLEAGTHLRIRRRR